MPLIHDIIRDFNFFLNIYFLKFFYQVSGKDLKYLHEDKEIYLKSN